MALQLARKKKASSKAAKAKRKTNAERFVDAIDVQLRIANGETVNKGRGVAKSWVGDGADYGHDKVIIPAVGAKKLYGKSVIVMNSTKGVAELQDLKKMIGAGKLTAKVNALYRKPAAKP